MKEKVEGHAYPRAHLLSLVRCLLGSYFVFLYATVLIICCFAAIFVAVVWRQLKDPCKNAISLLSPPHI